MGRHVHNLIFSLLYHEAMKKGKTGTPCEHGRALTPKVPRSNKVYTHRTTTTIQDGTVIVNKRGPNPKRRVLYSSANTVPGGRLYFSCQVPD